MRALVRLFLLAALASPAASQAGWLGLSDGLYDITLTCISVDATLCPSPFHASLTISGSQASAMSATFNNQVFSGTPVSGSGSNPIITFENASLTDTPFSSFALVYDLSGPGFPGLSDHWWGYCENVAVDECQPLAAGNWAATEISPAPEPSTAALIALGLAGCAAVKRRRSRGAPKRSAPTSAGLSPAA